MSNLLEDYESYLTTEKKASANTVSSYLRDVHQFAQEMEERDVPLDEVLPRDVEDYIRGLTRRGKSAATVTRSVASIKSFYNCLLSRGLVESNPARNVTAAKVERKLPQILTSREVELTRSQACFDQMLTKNVCKCKVSEKLELSGAERILQICHNEGTIKLDDVEIGEDNIQIDGVLEVSLLYLTSVDESPVQAAVEQVPPDNERWQEYHDLVDAFRYFEPVDPALVAPDSLLREFIGGGRYHY